MKKLFLTGIAALFLATGTAHAGFPHYYQCGEFSYYEQAFTGTPGQFEIAGPLPTKGPIVFRVWRKNILYVNGRRCKPQPHACIGNDPKPR
jgi:hypothetical protein